MAWPYAMSPEQFAEVLDLHLNRSLGGKRIEQETGLAERTVRQMLERWRKGELDADELARVGICVGDEPLSPSQEAGFDDIYPSETTTFLPGDDADGPVGATLVVAHHERTTEVTGEVTTEVDPVESKRVVVRGYTADGVPRPPFYDYFSSPDRYVFTLPCAPKPIALARRRVEGIVAGYSSGTFGHGKTLNQVAREQRMPRQMVIEILRALGKTHDSLPMTDERLEEDEDEELIEDGVRAKELRVVTEVERRRWNDLKAKAEKYELLEHSLLEAVAHVASQPCPDLPRALPTSTDPYAVFLRLPDLHFGKLGWCLGAEESSADDVAAKAHAGLEALLADLAHHGQPERLFFAFGDDWFHIDNVAATTSRGTPQDIAALPQDILEGGCALAIALIDRLRAVAPLELLRVSGNHDRIAGFMLGLVLAAHYRDCPEVSLTNAKRTHAFARYGVNLFGCAHGDGAKPADLPGIMANERAADWSACACRTWYTGHKHSLRVEERGGTLIRQMPTLSGVGRYEDLNGWLLERPAIVAHRYGRSDGYRGESFAALN